MTTDRLGAIDESYLVLESPTQPLHVGSIGLFDGSGLLDADGRLRLDEVRDRIRSRLDLLPRLRQRVAEVPMDVARPVWVDDAHFDIAAHVDAADIGPDASEADLLHTVERLMMEPLDRARPLWHLRLFTGLEDGRVAMVQRAHHAMIDGVSGVDVSITLLDVEPHTVDAPTTDWTPRPVPSAPEMVLDGVVDRVRALVDASSATAGLVVRPFALGHAVAEARGMLRTVLEDGLRAPRCSLNAPLGPSRRIELVRQHLPSIRAVAAPHGATVNDVVLSAVAGGLRSLFLARREEVEATRTVHVLVPVSVRSDAGTPTLGNQVGGLVVPLPIGIGDPAERLQAIAAITTALKASGEAQAADGILHLLDLLPPPLAHLIQHGIDRQPLVNMVVTNVPGPDFPLYALGSRLLEAFPLVPLGARMSLEVAVLSYAGQLTLGVVSDRSACPDAPVFTDGLGEALAALGASGAPVDRHPASEVG